MGIDYDKSLMRDSLQAAAASTSDAGRPALYLALTKPDVSFLVVMTTVAGYALGSRGPLDWLRMAHTVFGTTLIAAGTSALNHYFERDSDALMRRTASRPLPSGQLKPREAFWFAVSLLAFGTAYLALATNAVGYVSGSRHVGHVSVPLHAAEAAHHTGDLRGRVSGSSAAADRLGRCTRHVAYRGVVPFRHAFPVAVSAF